MSFKEIIFLVAAFTSSFSVFASDEDTPQWYYSCVEDNPITHNHTANINSCNSRVVFGETSPFFIDVEEDVYLKKTHLKAASYHQKQVMFLISNQESEMKEQKCIFYMPQTQKVEADANKQNTSTIVRKVLDELGFADVIFSLRQFNTVDDYMKRSFDATTPKSKIAEFFLNLSSDYFNLSAQVTPKWQNAMQYLDEPFSSKSLAMSDSAAQLRRTFANINFPYFLGKVLNNSRGNKFVSNAAPRQTNQKCGVFANTQFVLGNMPAIAFISQKKYPKELTAAVSKTLQEFIGDRSGKTLSDFKLLNLTNEQEKICHRCFGQIIRLLLPALQQDKIEAREQLETEYFFELAAKTREMQISLILQNLQQEESKTRKGLEAALMIEYFFELAAKAREIQSTIITTRKEELDYIENNIKNIESVAELLKNCESFEEEKDKAFEIIHKLQILNAETT